MGAAGHADPVVGRDAELGVLREALDAAAGRGGLALVSGPPGVGKTRLVEELSRCAAERGVAVGWGACIPDAGMPPRWPWRRALRAVPAAGAALDAHSATAGVSAEGALAARFALHAGVVDALGQPGLPAPLLVVLEDLHWADPSSLALLTHLLSELPRLFVLVVGTHRDPFSDPLGGPLAEALQLLSSGGSVVPVRLGPLAAADAAQLLGAVVGEALPAAEVRALAARAGGNPLLLRTLGRVTLTTNRVTTDPGIERSVAAAPELGQLVETAVRACGAGVADLVTGAAVVGPDAPPGLLAQVMEVPPGELDRRLSAAVAAGLVAAPDGGPVLMAHELLRDVLLARTPPEARARLHGAAARALEPYAMAAPAAYAHAVRPALAHAGAGADVEQRAAGWAARAAAQARDVAAIDEAAELLRLGIAASTRAGDAAGRAGLLLELARADYHAGRLPDALAACREVSAAGRALGRADLVAGAAVVVQGVGDPPTNAVSERLCRDALALADGVGDALRARVQAQLACTLAEVGDVAEAMTLSAAALRLAQASGDPNAELDAVRSVIAVGGDLGDPAERLRLGRRAVALAAPTGRPLGELWGRTWRADAAMMLGNLGAALSEIDALDAMATRTGLPLVRWHVLRHRAAVAVMRGDFAEARRLSAAATDIATRLQDFGGVGLHWAFSQALAWLRGDPRDIPADWREVIDRAPPLPVVRAGEAQILLLLGERAAAEAVYAGVPAVGSAPANVSDVAGCRELRGLIEPLFAHARCFGTGTVVYSGAVARLLGELALGAGDAAGAVPLAEQGLAVDAGLGARPYVAQGRLLLARALAARATGPQPPSSAPADLQRAADLARSAAAEAVQHWLLPHRTGDPTDVVADLAGVAVGALLPVRAAPRAAGRSERP